MSDPTPRTDDDTMEAGFPPAPPEARADALEVQAERAHSADAPSATAWLAADSLAAVPEGAEADEAIRQRLRAGVKAVSLPQLFATPMELARRMVTIAAPQIGERVLEPSAGSGNLLRALPGVLAFGAMRQTPCGVVAIELNLALKESLVNEGVAQRVIGGDFLECTPEDLGRFDVILMNAPFANGSDIAHIEHARRFLAPGGRLVAICADGLRQRERLSSLGSYEPLPEGSFASVGMNMRTAMVVIRG